MRRHRGALPAGGGAVPESRCAVQWRTPFRKTSSRLDADSTASTQASSSSIDAAYMRVRMSSGTVSKRRASSLSSVSALPFASPFAAFRLAFRLAYRLAYRLGLRPPLLCDCLHCGLPHFRGGLVDEPPDLLRGQQVGLEHIYGDTGEQFRPAAVQYPNPGASFSGGRRSGRPHRGWTPTARRRPRHRVPRSMRRICGYGCPRAPCRSDRPAA